MLRHGSRWLAKRTPGYVFWRQRSLTELEHSKRNYLLSERPVALGEIARRMARVKSRYEDTRDFHERNLLRGEYKYFTGKLCDLRAARLGDMVLVLQCAAFFGFWDAAQVERILGELFLQLESMEAVELVALFACMPQLRRHETPLYPRIAAELVPLVADLTLEECVTVCRACTAETPAALTERVLRELAAHVGELTPAQCVEVLDTWAVAPAAVQQRTRDDIESVQERAVDGVAELECMDVAILYTCLQGEAMSESLQRRLLSAFTRDLPRTCPRSTAMLFTAVRGTHALALELAQQMADRVLFLSTDFSPAELLAVLRVYVEGLTSLCAVAAELRADRAIAASLAATAPLPAPSAGVLGAAASSSLAVLAVAGASSRQRVLEVEQAAHSLATLQRVSDGLAAQLVDMLDSASAYLSSTSQLEIVELFVEAAAQLYTGEGTARAATTELLQLLPQARRALQLVSSKLIANMKALSLEELLALLEQANNLGNAALQDAVVAAAVQELIRRDIDGLSPEAALQLEQRLRSLTELRAEHQRRLSAALIPKVRRFV